MKVKSRMAREKVMVFIDIRMAISMKATGPIMSNLEKVNSPIPALLLKKRETSTRDNSKMASTTDGATMSMPSQANTTLANGKMTDGLAKASS